MKRSLYFLAALMAMAALIGCGAGNSGARTGRATFTVRWPQNNSRLVPAAANSVRVVVTLPAPAPAISVTVDRTPGQALSSVSVTVLEGVFPTVATAHPNLGGQGTAQARGANSLSILAGKNTNMVITMDSTIASANIVPAKPTVDVGKTIPLTGSFTDSAGSMVLVAASATQWKSAQASVATVDVNGVVTGVSAGNADITLTDTESGKSATVTVAVTKPDKPGEVVIGARVASNAGVPSGGHSFFATGGAVEVSLGGLVTYFDNAGTTVKTVNFKTSTYTFAVDIRDHVWIPCDNDVVTRILDKNGTVIQTLPTGHMTNAKYVAQNNTVLVSGPGGLLEYNPITFTSRPVVSDPCGAAHGDGKFIYYFAGQNELFKVPVAGGMVTNLGKIGLIFDLYAPPGRDLIIATSTETQSVLRITKSGSQSGYPLLQLTNKDQVAGIGVDLRDPQGATISIAPNPDPAYYPGSVVDKP